MSLEIRAAKPSELSKAARLLSNEGWGFTAEEMERLARLGGTMAAVDGKEVVGFLTYVDLTPVRWVGNVAVSETHRGQGIGGLMMEATVAAPGPVTTTGLYSVEKAVTLYERAGFKPAGEAFVMRAPDAHPRGSADAVTPMEDYHLPGVFRLDKRVAGMDRRALLGELLAAYPDHGCVLDDGRGGVAGFGFAKPYDGVTELGPIVAETQAGARVLLDALLDVTPGPHETTVLGENVWMRELLEKRGFEAAFRTVTMFRGEAPTWKPDALALTAGLEKS